MRGTSEFDMSPLYGNDNDRLRLLCVTHISLQGSIVGCSIIEDNSAKPSFVTAKKEEARPPQNHGGDASSIVNLPNSFCFVNNCSVFCDDDKPSDAPQVSKLFFELG